MVLFANGIFAVKKNNCYGTIKARMWRGYDTFAQAT